MSVTLLVAAAILTTAFLRSDFVAACVLYTVSGHKQLSPRHWPRASQPHLLAAVASQPLGCCPMPLCCIAMPSSNQLARRGSGGAYMLRFGLGLRSDDR